MEGCLDEDRFAAALQQGQAGVFPTDTLPALATTPEHAALLWRIKRRPQNKPVILMGADGEQLFSSLGLEPEQSWIQLMEQHWPGALTLVVPAGGEKLELLNPGGAALGLRVPDCDQARNLLRISGPLATTSANRSGEEPCKTAAEVQLKFPELNRLAPEPWPSPSGQASTVIALEPGGNWRLLRAGAVMPRELLN
ncbi:L-threonylcarbamoyladenylate synthase [Synechococcus sp. A10-1-5-1]|jgi:L-threonylcarbamoyladenylate synthase|uniref:L-threonylcarbamoyladenylate synthase n=1 Tax=Synechococcus sp. A10-1-5-1 TaxID=2936507 RepID=UPI0020011972|nr:L-threonylcarbamoyladenylate synthase [Synechococcus sp. A10-1-5-1]UPM49051.1 L-threonylcarbamoyladenylate synthase [Synechococcus sp. A10-1-5-1]